MPTVAPDSYDGGMASPKRRTTDGEQAAAKEAPAAGASGPGPAAGLQDLLSRLLEQESSFRAFLRRRVGDDALAEDLFQQSLMRAVERQHTLRSSENVVAWFYRILRNAVIDCYRSQAADVRKTDAFLQELVTAGEDKTPALDELRPTVCACLQRLLPAIRPAYAELLRRIDLQGEPLSSVAKDLKLTSNNLTVRLHRARRALRASLERSCGLCTKHGCLSCTCE